MDWKTVKTEYITTDTSYRKLASKYGVSQATITKHSKDEAWIEERKRYRNKTVAKSLDIASGKESRRLARLMTAANKAVDVAVKAFDDDKQFHRYIITEGLGEGATETSERIFDKVDTKALKDLTGVLKELTGLMRDFYNIPTPAQAEAQRIAVERLELDRRRADADSSDDNIEVIIDGDAKEWAK